MKSVTESKPILPKQWERLLVLALLVLGLLFYGLAFVHLKADFPNFSPWNDWSKTTDEGWYAGGAVHREVFGQWITPGAFNPVVAMPVWSVLAHAWFRVVGFGIVQLRVASLLLFGISLLLFFRLMRQAAGLLYAALAVALLTTNPFVYSFTRLALLEQAMLFWLFLAWTLSGLTARRNGSIAALFAILTGCCITAMVLTKTTGAVLVPAILWFQWFSADPATGISARVRAAIYSIAAAAASWISYDRLVIRRHFADYFVVFSVNNYRVHLSIVPRVAWQTLLDGAWIDPALYTMALLGLVLAAWRLRELWRVPLFTAAALAGAAYLGFILYHSNLQPRYYLVAAPSVVIIVVLTLRALVLRAERSGQHEDSASPMVYQGAAVTGCLLLVATLLVMSARTVRYATHLDYGYLTAMNQVASIIQSDATVHPLLVANQGDNVSLYTGVRSICDAYHSAKPDELLTRYQPGWYATIAGGKQEAMLTSIKARYRVEERAHFEVFDDPDRHTLMLYRLVPR